MKLTLTGTPEGPDVLLLSGERLSPEELCAALPGLADKYRLLSARSGKPEELYDALRAAGTIRLWGAYGLEEGASSLLALLAQGRMDVVTAVTEGPFVLPDTSLRDWPGRLICWTGGRDKKAKKAWAALKADRPTLRSLTLDKLKSGVTYVSRRPDLMEKQLIAAFGEAEVLRSRDVLPGDAERAWRRLSARPAGLLQNMLRDTEPLELDHHEHIQRFRGRGGALVFWDRLTVLENAGDGACVCTDQAFYAAEKQPGLVKKLSRLYLAGERRRRSALMKRG